MSAQSDLGKRLTTISILSIFWGMLLALLLVFPLFSRFEIGLEFLLKSLSYSIVLCALLALLLAPSVAIRKKSTRRMVLLLTIFSTCCFLYADNLHYLFTGQHIGAKQIALLSDGAASDMFTFTPSLILQIASFSALALFSISCSIAISETLSQYKAVRMSILIGLSLSFLPSLVSAQITKSEKKESLLALRSLFLWHELHYGHDNQKLLIEDQTFAKDTALPETLLRAKHAEIHKTFDAIPKIQSEKKPNILFLTIESLRSDMFSAETMPYLYSRRSNWMLLDKSYSGGANSGTGDFSLTTGLSARFYPTQKLSPLTPVPLKVLKALGYENSIYFTNDMRYEGVYKNIFQSGMDSTIEVPKQEQPEWDRSMTNRVVSDLQTRNYDIPFFTYVRFHVTHFDFSFPEEFRVFTPALDKSFMLSAARSGDFEKYKDKLFNSFKNSTLFVDYLIEQILKALEEKGELDNTIVVVAGDHGEEFWEHGYYGHTFGLVNEQIQTVAMIRFPQKMDTQYKISSHADFMPSILDYMKVKPNLSNLMSGKSLLAYEPSLDFTESTEGVLRDDTVETYAVIGKGIKAFVRESPQYEVWKVCNLNDIVKPNFNREDARELLLSAKSRIERLAK